MDFNLTLIGQTIAMIVFVWFVMAKIWPPVMAALDQRRKEIADGIAAGEKGQKELADARHGSDAILAEARQKAGQVVDIAHKRSSELVGEAKNLAVTESERIVTAARGEAANEKTRARDALRKEVAALALAGAHESARPRSGRKGSRRAPRRAGRGTGKAGAAKWLIAQPSQGHTRGRHSPTRRSAKDLAGWSKLLGAAAIAAADKRVARLIGNPHVTGEELVDLLGGLSGKAGGRGRPQLPEGARGEPPARASSGNRGAVRAASRRHRERRGRGSDRGAENRGAAGKEAGSGAREAPRPRGAHAHAHRRDRSSAAPSCAPATSSSTDR